MRTVTLCHTSNKFTVITEPHITHSSSVSQSRAILTLSPGSPPSLSLSLLSDNDNDNDQNDHNDDCDDV